MRVRYKGQSLVGMDDRGWSVLRERAIDSRNGFRPRSKAPAQVAGPARVDRHATALALVIRRAEEDLPEHGIVIGEAASPDDLRKWTALRNDSWLMAGGVDFFSALTNLSASKSPSKTAVGKELFVSGSASEVTRNFVTLQAQQGVPLFLLLQGLAAGASFDAGSLPLWGTKS